MYQLKFAFLLAFWFSFFNLEDVIGQDTDDHVLPSPTTCLNCTICPYPCHQLPPPTPSGYPSYGTPPPPVSGYPLYGTPPPPPQLSGPQSPGNCPPTPARCCGYPPPSAYGYIPQESHSASPYSPLLLFSLVMLLFLFALLL